MTDLLIANPLLLPILGAVCAGAGFAIVDGLVDWLTDRAARDRRAARREGRRIAAAAVREQLERQRAGRC